MEFGWKCQGQAWPLLIILFGVRLGSAAQQLQKEKSVDDTMHTANFRHAQWNGEQSRGHNCHERSCRLKHGAAAPLMIHPVNPAPATHSNTRHTHTRHAIIPLLPLLPLPITSLLIPFSPFRGFHPPLMRIQMFSTTHTHTHAHAHAHAHIRTHTHTH